MGFMDDVRNEMQKVNQSQQEEEYENKMGEEYENKMSSAFSGNFMDMVKQEMSKKPENIKRRMQEEAMQALEEEIKMKLFSMIKSNDISRDSKGKYVSCKISQCPSFKKVFPKSGDKVSKGILFNDYWEVICLSSYGSDCENAKKNWEKLKIRLGLEGILLIEERYLRARVDLPD